MRRRLLQPLPCCARAPRVPCTGPVCCCLSSWRMRPRVACSLRPRQRSHTRTSLRRSRLTPTRQACCARGLPADGRLWRSHHQADRITPCVARSHCATDGCSGGQAPRGMTVDTDSQKGVWKTPVARQVFCRSARRSNSRRQGRTRPAGGSSPRDALQGAARWHLAHQQDTTLPPHAARPQSQSPSTAASSSAAAPLVSPAWAARPSLRSSAVCFSVAGCRRHGASASTSRATPRCRA